ncbi:probable protein phosphatase 2C 12 [Camellia sinensis]|uniref:probable protein phosphatase 2C 12 n=1 Tax=Camellia sinensis TaxID=4442 RepID=UPI00103584B5|nr:probable protein phosphatase 2C 12 [Camellia sinensis]XP_028093027.1 probable protein phosphatase 2C 12 [Camellia sinensis]
MSSKGQHLTVPLSVLLNRELANEKIERPEISHGQACQSKKGEDFTFLKTECQRVVAGDDVSTYSVFAIFDGHNGSAAAIYSEENLLNNVLAAIPSDLNRDEWVAALPRALVAGFVKTDKDFQEKGMGCFCVSSYQHAFLIWSYHGQEKQSCGLSNCSKKKKKTKKY